MTPWPNRFPQIAIVVKTNKTLELYMQINFNIILRQNTTKSIILIHVILLSIFPNSAQNEYYNIILGGIAS